MHLLKPGIKRPGVYITPFLFLLLACMAMIRAHAGESSSWTQLAPSGSAPATRMTHGAVYDETHNRMILFGGMEPLFNDTWVLVNADGTSGAPAWIQVVPTNSPPGARAWP